MKNRFLRDGIVLLNKKRGVTSFKAINQLKRILGVNKIGHAGTLDPLAEGLLIVMLNGATKFSDDLMKKNKEYYVEMELGYETDTYDTEGKVTKRYGGKIEIPLQKITETVKSFLGKSRQIPPMYSAIKVDGEKLYDLARKGIEIEREARDIEIRYIDRIKYSQDRSTVSFLAGVSSGTYIRSLVRDIGERLGVYATMTKLVRTGIDKFELKDAADLEKIEKEINEAVGNRKLDGVKDRYKIEQKIFDMMNDMFENKLRIESDEKIMKIINFKEIEQIFNYEKININKEKYLKLRNGMTVLFGSSKFRDAKFNKRYRAYHDGKFTGILKVIKIGENKVYLKREKYFL